jgi:hypothetical protein
MKRETYYRILHFLAGIAIGWLLFSRSPKVICSVVEIPKTNDITTGATGSKLNYYNNLYARKDKGMD